MNSSEPGDNENDTPPSEEDGSDDVDNSMEDIMAAIRRELDIEEAETKILSPDEVGELFAKYDETDEPTTPTETSPSNNDTERAIEVRALVEEGLALLVKEDGTWDRLTDGAIKVIHDLMTNHNLWDDDWSIELKNSETDDKRNEELLKNVETSPSDNVVDLRVAKYKKDRATIARWAVQEALTLTVHEDGTVGRLTDDAIKVIHELMRGNNFRA